MEKIMNIFKFLFCKKKQITCLDGLPTEIRYVILAHWYENRIFKSKEKFVEFTSHNWYGRIQNRYDHELKVKVNQYNDFYFISPRLIKDFVLHFGNSTGFNILKKQIRSKIIRQHIESYIMSVSFPFPYDLSGIGGHMYMYYHVKELLRGLVVCDNARDIWLHYLTIEYVSSDASRKIGVHANWNLEFFKLQIDSDTFVEIPGRVSYYSFYENVESQPKLYQFFKSLAGPYRIKILDEGLLGKSQLCSIA